MSFRDRKPVNRAPTTAPPIPVGEPGEVVAYPLYSVTWDCGKGFGEVRQIGTAPSLIPWYMSYGFKGSGMGIYTTASATLPTPPHHLLPCVGC